MNTKQLQSFVTVAKMHNITETAKILDYSPSTIHAHLSSLEEELECKLYPKFPRNYNVFGGGVNPSVL